MRRLAQAVNFMAGKWLQSSRIYICTSLNYLHRKRHIDPNYLDYIRLATLELVSREIHEQALPGNIAELGVYKGKFARYLNEYFPDRTLYLFDTFEGFDKRDVKEEKSKAYSSGEQNFSGTSIAEVLQRMKHPERCVPVKGYFPESAKSMDDTFVFVSLDTDLYEPIYAGLQYFYPRLVAGGYIFVHDFNNDGYKGVREAVKLFCAENNTVFTPLPDSGGTAILKKSNER